MAEYTIAEKITITAWIITGGGSVEQYRVQLFDQFNPLSPNVGNFEQSLYPGKYI